MFFHRIVNKFAIFATSLLIILPSTVFVYSQDSECSINLVKQFTDEYTGSISWSPDGRHIAAIQFEPNEFRSALVAVNLHIIEHESWSIVDVVPRDIFLSTIPILAWSPDSSELAIIGGSDGVVEIYNLEQGESRFLSLPVSDYAVRQVMWSSDGRELAVAGHDRFQWLPGIRYGDSTHIWDLESEEIITTFGSKALHQLMIDYLDDEWMVAYRHAEDEKVSVMSLRDNEVFYEVSDMYLADFDTSSGEMIAAFFTLGTENTIEIWNLSKNQQIFNNLEEQFIAVRNLQGDNYFIASTGNRDFAVYDLQNNTVLYFEGQSVSLSSTGQYAIGVEFVSGGSVTRSLAGANELIRVTTGERLASVGLGMIGQASVTAWSPDDNYLVSLDNGNGLNFWSLDNCDVEISN